MNGISISVHHPHLSNRCGPGIMNQEVASCTHGLQVTSLTIRMNKFLIIHWNNKSSANISRVVHLWLSKSTLLARTLCDLEMLSLCIQEYSNY